MPTGSLGRAQLEFSANTAKFNSDVGKAAHKFNQASDAMSRRVKQLAVAFVSFAAARSITRMITSTIDAGDHLAKLSQQIGVSVESLSALQHAASLSGATAETLAKGLKFLAKNAADVQLGTGEAIYALDALGLSVEDSNGVLKKSEVLFSEVADKFQGMEDGAGKTAIAMKIFGKAGAELIPLLNQGSAGIKEMTDEAERLGIVWDTKTAQAAERFNDNVTRLTASFEAFKKGIVENVLPTLVELSNKFVDAQASAENFLGFIQSISGKGAPLTLGEIEIELTGLREAREILSSDVDKQIRKSGDPIADAINTALGTKIQHDLNAVENRIRFLEIVSKRAQVALGKTEGVFGFDDPNAKTTAPALRDLKREAAEAAKRAKDAAALAKGNAKTAKDVEDELDAAALRAADQVARSIEAFSGANADMLTGLDTTIEKMDDLGDAAKRNEEFAKELGMTFSSAFEDAVVNGAKLSEVLKGLEKDIIRIITRKLVTEPFAAAIGSIASGIGGGAGGGNVLNAIFQGLSGVAGAASGMDFVPRDMPVFVHKGEAIIPAAQNAGGGGRGVIVNMNINTPDANSFRASTQQITSDMSLAVSRAGRNA